ncbi:Fic family protein [Serpentinimonas barnesii]|uniref:Fic family protein n=1 Tax=Serpentinimonas barnesii TaxID=1458427 RepID=UPI0004957DAB|nr:Fic family protein [Serpentinimonas barnesii]
MASLAKKPTGELLLYAEMAAAEVRAAQRQLKAGQLHRIAAGVLTPWPEASWPGLVARERIRLLAALYPGAVVGPKSAFYGGVPHDGVMHLTYTYTKRVALPGMTVQLIQGPGASQGDTPMMGRELYYPSLPRMLLENLSITRGQVQKSVGRVEVERRLIETCEARGEEVLNHLREQARDLAPGLGLQREQVLLDELIGAILGTRQADMQTQAGKGLAAAPPYDANRLALLEKLAAHLRASPLKQAAAVATTDQARVNFAFLESYFSNFIEGTEFDVQDARGFVLQGRPITTRPKDSHDVLGVFRQAVNPGWANQTLGVGEPVLHQLRDRHRDQMAERPEVGPGEFKTQANRAGNTEFVAPRLVRGTLVEGSKLLPTVPAGMARALLAMFLVAEVHPFTDGNGRLARLVMNAELSVVGASRLIIPTLFREEYLDCLRALTRQGDPAPFVQAMQHIHAWTAAFNYDDLDRVLAQMAVCHAFEKSRIQHKLLFP